MPEFRPFEVLQALNDEDVDYVVIGGFAGTIHGSPTLTEDVDFVPDWSEPNLARLARALNRLNARIRIDGGVVPTKIDGAFLAAMPHMLNLATDAGDVDITFTPSGPLKDFDAWNERALLLDAGDGLMIRVASLDDVIDSKRAANRPKDLAGLPYLESLRDQIRLLDATDNDTDK